MWWRFLGHGSMRWSTHTGVLCKWAIFLFWCKWVIIHHLTVAYVSYLHNVTPRGHDLDVIQISALLLFCVFPIFTNCMALILVSGLVTTAFGNQKNLPKLMCYINTKVGLEPKLVQIPILPFYLVSLKSKLHWKCSIPKIPGCCTTSSYISLYATQHAFWLFCPTSSAQKIRWWHYRCADH